MKGDFSRAYGAPKGNDNGVLYQHGRVFTDSDGNAQTAITTAWQDTAGRDVVGPNLAAVPAEEAASFKVEAADLAAGEVTLTVAPGRVWADGLLVRLDDKDQADANSPPGGRRARWLAARDGTIAREFQIAEQPDIRRLAALYSDGLRVFALCNIDPNRRHGRVFVLEFPK